MSSIVHNDEPTKDDRLDRARYAKAFGNLGESCETPMTIGIYGSWGVGKTSLMQMIEAELSSERCRAVWFNAWEHQFDEVPAVALLQSMVEQLDLGSKAKKLIITISAALGGALLKNFTSISTDDIGKFAKQYEEERYQIRDSTIRLKEYFSGLIDEALNPRSRRRRKLASASRYDRIVFFIDDLDRCNPHQALSILEAIKLHLNIENCVYFLGVDRQALEQSIASHYKEFEFDKESYLDKLIQLPFTIPPIAPEAMSEFLAPLLVDELQECKEQLILGLGDSPRQVKRFVNTLSLNHAMALELRIENYSPVLLSTLLLIQMRSFEIYNFISFDPGVLIPETVDNGYKISDALLDLLKDDIRLKQAIEVVADRLPKSRPDVLPYLHLTSVLTASEVPEADTSGRYELYTSRGEAGSASDVDFLMTRLDESDDFSLTKLIDYSLDLVKTREGKARIRHYLFNGSKVQRNFATLTLRRRGDRETVKEAFEKGLIDRKQAFAK